MMVFNDFIKKYNLENEATSNIKIQQVLSSLSLNDIGVYLRDGPVNLILESLTYTLQKERIGFVI